MKKMTNAKIYWLSFAAALLLVLSGVSYWLGSTIFNEQVFVNETVAVMTSDETIQNLSGEITEKALEGKPVIKNLLGDRIESVVSGLLSTDTFSDAVRGASARIYNQITTEKPKGVVINVEAVKNLVGPIAEVVATPEQKAKLEELNIPDEIIIINPNSVPTIYPLTNYLWIWPFALFGALGIVAYIVYGTEKKMRLQNTQKVAAVIAAVMALAIAIIPTIEPAIVKNIESYNLKVVAGDIYTALSAYLINIYVFIATLSIAILIGIFGYSFYKNRRSTKVTSK